MSPSPQSRLQYILMIEWNRVTWYSRLGAMIFLLGVLPAVSFYIGTQYELTATSLAEAQTAVLSSKMAIATSTSPASISIKVPLDPSLLRKGAESFESVSDLVSSSTQDAISFKEVTGSPQGQNPSFDVFLNGVSIGETGGLELTIPGFSPSKKYFVFQAIFACGAGCVSFDMNVIDTAKARVLELALPVDKEGDQINKDGGYEYQSVESFVESYSWDGSGNLDITQYAVATDQGGAYYRITPKEIWQYDLVTNQPDKLISTLPE